MNKKIEKEAMQPLVFILIGLALLNTIPYLLPITISFLLEEFIILFLLITFYDFYFCEYDGYFNFIESKFTKFIYLYMTYIFLFAGNYGITLWIEFELRGISNLLEPLLEPSWLTIIILIVVAISSNNKKEASDEK
jgi:hypothetical protein